MNDLHIPRPQVPRSNQPQSARTQVVAQQHDYSGPIAADNSELSGFLNGLSAVNPVLSRFADHELERKKQAEQEELDLMKAKARAAGEGQDQPMSALRGEPEALPADVPPAFDQQYRKDFNTAVARRAAIEIRAGINASYQEQKDTEGFNLDAFLAQQRQGALRGVSDPHVVSILGEHLAETEASIRSQYLRSSVEKHEENKQTTASRLTEEFTADMTPEQMADKHFAWYVPQMRSIGVDPKQSAGFLLNRIKSISVDAGGRPDLFDVFNQKDAEGFSVLDRNPQLQDHILQAREQATRQRDEQLKAAKQPAIARLYMVYDDDVRDAPERVTPERLASDVAGSNLTAEKASSYYHEAQVSLGKKKAMNGMLLDAEAGMLGFYDPKDQNHVLDDLVGPAAKAAWQAAVAGDSKAVQGYVQAIMQKHSQTGATVPVDTLQRLMETNVSNLPSPDGPSQKFLATAEIYKALAADPKYRDMYFKGDAKEVMDSFAENVAGGLDAKTAYTNAYRTIDPAFKEAAAKRASAPEMQDKIRSLATKYATGSTMWGWLPGGNGRPENTQMLGAWAATEVRKALTANPDLTDKQLQDHIERKSQENFVLDTSSQLAVKVPPGLSGDMTQKAVSAYSKAMGDSLREHGQFPDGSVIRYIPLNGEGLYEVQAWNGARQTRIGSVMLGDVVQRFKADSTLSDAEGAKLVEVRNAIRNGAPMPNVDPAVLAKGTSVGFFKSGELQSMERSNKLAILQRLRAVPDFGYGKPTNDTSPLPLKPNAVIDAKTTSKVAADLAAPTPITGLGNSHMSLAGSLIAMREGVSLTAYPDPNPDAGMNIGAGYNLKANAATVDSDLKRAGVPADRIADVKSGKASLTPEQVKNLIVVSTPRYEQQARKVAEANAPGLWDSMTPAQRAVMVDIAYQTGDPAQFKKAWSALAAGKTQEFSEETRVFYKNKAGERVEDRRARELRASMLAGTADWNTRVQLAGR